MCVGDTKSEWADIRRGVLQGSILGPLLFIFYANDITQAIPHNKVIQYAYDTTVSLVSNDVSGVKKGLVDDLDSVARWVEMNKLKLNGQKTQLLLLSRKRRAKEYVEIEMNGQRIERSKCVKCLGTLLDDGLTWKEQVQNVRKLCFAGLAKLRRLKDCCHQISRKRYIMP